VAVTFLHTSDWQLGKAFRTLAGADTLRRLRFEVLGRLAAVARDEAAAFVVVAGDVFEHPEPAPEDVAAFVDGVRAFDVPVYVLPGNHDPAAPGTVWAEGAIERIGGRPPPPNLVVLRTADPVVVADGRAVLLPAPLSERDPVDDPVAHLARADTYADLPPDAARVVVAHGSVSDFGQRAAAARVLALDRMPPGAVDYVALGDWHGCKQVMDDPAAWYSGAPEPDGFAGAAAEGRTGVALVVSAERGRPAAVRPVEVSATVWVRDTWRLPATSLEAIAERLRRWGASGRTWVLDVRIEGVVSPEDRARLERTIEAARKWTLGRGFDLSEVYVHPAAEALEALADGATPIVRAMLAALEPEAFGARARALASRFETVTREEGAADPARRWAEAVRAVALSHLVRWAEEAAK